MSEPFETTAARLLRINQRPPNEILGDGDDHGTISVRELAAALRSAEESAARRCAEIAAGTVCRLKDLPCDGTARAGDVCGCVLTSEVAEEIRSEFGLGEEGA